LEAEENLFIKKEKTPRCFSLHCCNCQSTQI